MAEPQKQTVLIIGASGRTGSVIADTLLNNPSFVRIDTVPLMNIFHADRPYLTASDCRRSAPVDL